MTFVGMKVFGVDANIVALSGIAIAIGTIVDMGIVICENILKHLDEADPGEPRSRAIYRGVSEVGGAVFTAILTTVVSFLPVFTMEAAEGKLFKPLAYTKTFALIASIVIALTAIPAAAGLLLRNRNTRSRPRRSRIVNIVVVLIVAIVLSESWLPLGPARGLVANLVFVAALLAVVIVPIWLYMRFYVPILRWCLDHKARFLSVPAVAVLIAALVWLGFPTVFGVVPRMADAVGLGHDALASFPPWNVASRMFPGLGKEFMPDLDEGLISLHAHHHAPRFGRGGDRCSANPGSGDLRDTRGSDRGGEDRSRRERARSRARFDGGDRCQLRARVHDRRVRSSSSIPMGPGHRRLRSRRARRSDPGPSRTSVPKLATPHPNT